VTDANGHDRCDARRPSDECNESDRFGRSRCIREPVDQARNKNARAETPERVVSRLASGQEGAVHLHQLVAGGLTPKVVRRLARSGVLHERHPRVYIVGHLSLAPFAEETAALLACGDGALISHGSAACLGDCPAGHARST